MVVFGRHYYVMTDVDEDHFSQFGQRRLTNTEERMTRLIVVDFDGRHSVGSSVNLVFVQGNAE